MLFLPNIYGEVGAERKGPKNEEDFEVMAKIPPSPACTYDSSSKNVLKTLHLKKSVVIILQDIF